MIRSAGIQRGKIERNFFIEVLLIGTNEVLLRHENHWLHFSKPQRVFTTKRVHEVPDLLREVEALVNSQSGYAAGFLSYEAAPAFDKALRVLDAGDFPLLWFGVYPKPQKVDVSFPGQKLDSRPTGSQALNGKVITRPLKK